MVMISKKVFSSCGSRDLELYEIFELIKLIGATDNIKSEVEKRFCIYNDF